MTYEFMNRINGIISHYNAEKYWKYKEDLFNNKGSLITRYFKLLYLKKCDAFNGASLGHRIEQNGGSKFKTPPFLPHGIKGIFISDLACLGERTIIYQHVTIGININSNGAPKIGDNVFIGAGASIIGNITIGNNVKVGANCVVYFDVPDNCTVVLEKPRVIHGTQTKEE